MFRALARFHRLNGFHPMPPDHDLYTIHSLDLGEPRPDRRFAPNINRFFEHLKGDVHLNVLGPGARAGNHFHRQVRELFINTGPEPLILHLQDASSGRTVTIPMRAPSLDRILAYQVERGVVHSVENPGDSTVTLLVVVDEDNPDDVVPAAAPERGA